MANYPQKETLWVSINDDKGNMLFAITSKTQRDVYYLYKIEDGEWKKVASGKDPSLLEKKNNVFKECCKKSKK